MNITQLLEAASKLSYEDQRALNHGLCEIMKRSSRVKATIVGASFVLTGGDNPSRFATGRNVFIGTIVGLLLVLLARAVFAAIQNIFGN